MSMPDVQTRPLASEPKATATVAAPAESWSLLRWLVVAGLIVVLGAAATALVKMMPTEGVQGQQEKEFLDVTKPDGPAGKAVIDSDLNYNFGVLAQNQEGTHTWVLKNEGHGDLLLSKGRADCSCTIANFSDSKPTYVLKAGDHTEVTLSWNTRTFDGGFKKSADVNILNDPDRQTLEFTIAGSVRPAITVQPPEKATAFGSVASDATERTKFAIASADKPDLKILKLTTTSPDEVSASAAPLPDADRKGLGWDAMKGGYLISVEIKPSTNLGVFQEEVIVTTDHPVLPEVRFTVGGKRDGPIRLTPDAVRMHQVKSDDGAATTIMISIRNAPDTKLEVVETPDNLKVEIIPSDVKIGTVAKVRQVKMIVTVPPGTPAGLIGGIITLKSDHPQARQVKIPVDVIILGGE